MLAEQFERISRVSCVTPLAQQQAEPLHSLHGAAPTAKEAPCPQHGVITSEISNPFLFVIVNLKIFCLFSLGNSPSRSSGSGVPCSQSRSTVPVTLSRQAAGSRPLLQTPSPSRCGPCTLFPTPRCSATDAAALQAAQGAGIHGGMYPRLVCTALCGTWSQLGTPHPTMRTIWLPPSLIQMMEPAPCKCFGAQACTSCRKPCGADCSSLVAERG